MRQMIQKLQATNGYIDKQQCDDQDYVIINKESCIESDI